MSVDCEAIGSGHMGQAYAHTSSTPTQNEIRERAVLLASRFIEVLSRQKSNVRQAKAYLSAGANLIAERCSIGPPFKGEVCHALCIQDRNYRGVLVRPASNR